VNLCTQIKDTLAEEHNFFKHSLSKPLLSQQRHLQCILRNNQYCEYGVSHNFSAIKTIEEFQQNVPIVDYDNISQYIKRMQLGESNILCTEAVKFFEVTGGSTAGPKYIPYTNNSLIALRSALHPWLYDLLDNRKNIINGYGYWAISPKATALNITEGGIPIGIDNDVEYFGHEVAQLLSKTFVYSPSMLKNQSLNAWRYITLRHLLAKKALRFISVWSPTFILDLMDYLKNNYQCFINDIASGQVSFGFDESFQADVERARTIETACQGGKINVRLLWRELDTISCWVDGSAGIYIEQLRDLFPGIYIQGKGLLATEGVISIPFYETNKSVLAVNSGFYEFLGDDNKAYLCTDVQLGECYQMVITTYAGLYRYAIGDRVRVTGWHEKTPQLEFIGRGGLVSDLCGEKLTEDFVLDRLPKSKGFAMLSPMIDSARYYILLLDAENWCANEAELCAVQVEAKLNDNPQYQYARKIGQLARVKFVCIDSPWKHYIDFLERTGRRVGDIKPTAIAKNNELFAYFMQKNAIKIKL
jgi:hypothetical protein